MKYSIEIVGTECIESFSFKDKTYIAVYQKPSSHRVGDYLTKSIVEQLEEDGYDPNFLDEYDKTFDEYNGELLFRINEYVK